jgi:hypothetical protein
MLVMHSKYFKIDRTMARLYIRKDDTILAEADTEGRIDYSCLKPYIDTDIVLTYEDNYKNAEVWKIKNIVDLPEGDPQGKHLLYLEKIR